MKQIWLNAFTWINKLKQTQEIKLIIAGLLVIAFFLWGMLKDNYSELKQSNRDKDKIIIEMQKKYETHDAFMQDKLEQCKDEKVKNLEQMLIVSEKFKKLSKIK